MHLKTADSAGHIAVGVAPGRDRRQGSRRESGGLRGQTLLAVGASGGGANEETPQDGQDAGNEAARDGKNSDDSGNKTPRSEDLKVVVSIKGGRAVIGVQQPDADPQIETFEGHDLSGLAREVPAVSERARARWEDTPKHPAYARPVPVRSRSRRGQVPQVRQVCVDAIGLASVGFHVPRAELVAPS